MRVYEPGQYADAPVDCRFEDEKGLASLKLVEKAMGRGSEAPNEL